MNKYDKLFKQNMSTKQVTMLFFMLDDEIAGNEDERRMLDEAHMRAWRRANKRETNEAYDALENGYALCAN